MRNRLQRHVVRYTTYLQTNFRIGIESLLASKQRSLLALIGIVVGIASVIAMISIGSIVRNESVKQFKDLGTDVMSIRRLHGGDVDENLRLELEDAQELEYRTPSVVSSAPWIETRARFSYAGVDIGSGQLLGVTQSFANLNKLPIVEGRFLSDLDFRRKYCVVGSDIALAINTESGKNALGQRLKALGKTYQIIGVLERVDSRVQLNVNTSAFVPISTAQRDFANSEITEIIARMDPDIHYSEVEQDIKAYFRTRDDRLEIGILSAKRIIDQIQKQLSLITLLLGAIGSISLIVGGVGVMNVMLSSINERRKEIGLRRAIGARRVDIQSQFLIESTALSIIGGVIGTVIGIGGSYALCQMNDWDFAISATAISLGIGVAFTVGIFFGFIPAYQAAKIDPIMALRST